MSTIPTSQPSAARPGTRKHRRTEYLPEGYAYTSKRRERPIPELANIPAPRSDREFAERLTTALVSNRYESQARRNRRKQAAITANKRRKRN